MDLSCPKCRSGEVRRLSLVYREGLSHVNTSTTGVGASFGGGGGLGVGAASTKGTHQSVLSQEAAPPERKKTEAAVLFAVITGLGLFATFSDFSGWTLFWLAATGLSINSTRLFMRYNDEVFPSLKSTWERTFQCFRCGEKFEIAE